MENKLKRFPMFIVGCLRSGTTLLGLMLDSHPDISVAHEAAIFHFLYQQGKQRWRLSSAGDRKKFFEKLEQYSQICPIGTDLRLRE